MTILARLIKSTLSKTHLRYLSTNIIREELTVQTFCDIYVNVPFNVKVKPLDVHKYHNCDLLRIELQGVKNARSSVKHIQDGNNIRIFATTEEYDEDAVCNIRAPVKANLNINAHGHISCGVFSGSKLILKSVKGNIFVDKYQGDVIDLNTDNGDIVMKGAVVASDIKAIANFGTIKAKRMQGLNAFLNAKQGSILVDSSYCDSGVFDASGGDLSLQNLHKNSKIYLKDGRLNLTGLDGQLEANLSNSSAEIQISRILGDSKITMTENGELKLHLSEECQENTVFEINAKEHTFDPSIKSIPSATGSTLYLTPLADECKSVLVECEGRVDVLNASWINMLNLSVKKID